ncbi:MAG: HipA domain-containing protein [Pseudomonadota bacterium]
MTFNQKAIVYIFLSGDGYVPAGTLNHFPLEKYSTFQYGKKYLLRFNALPIDPVRLPLAQIVFKTPENQSIFNIFKDAAPDKWGRRVLSIMSGVKADAMTEFEILTAMSPQYRIGALAFGSDARSGPESLADWYKDDTFKKTIKNLKEIAKYVRLVDEIDDEDLDSFREMLSHNQVLKEALAISLSPAGGARPKALVSYNGTDWIGKFPKRGDVWNEPLIEHGCLTLAGKCGIIVPETQIIKQDGIDILLVKRFDKDEAGNPLHFASAFTIGDLFEDQSWGSYQDLASAARRYGDADVGEQIFRRMIFNVLCVNTDDHPRNHAFFIFRNKIKLTPAYDIVPCRFRFNDYNLALKIGEQGNTASIKNALSNVGPFGLSTKEAESIVSKMQSIVSKWPDHFQAIGVNQKDLKELEHRFSYGCG